MTLLTVLVSIVAFVVVFKVMSPSTTSRDEPVWATYGLVIGGFIGMRFLLGWLYRPCRMIPTAFSLGGDHRARLQRPDIARTLDACLDRGLSGELFRVVVVDDKSTDETLERIGEWPRRIPTHRDSGAGQSR